jgi:hypothetical protein
MPRLMEFCRIQYKVCASKTTEEGFQDGEMFHPMWTHGQLVSRMLENPAVRAEYEAQTEEFALLDESLRTQVLTMPSPFPGMDPYLEAHWRDVHASLIIYARDALQGVLPAPLRARVEERVLLETPQGFADHPLFPDVRVVEYAQERGLQTRPAGGAAVAEPLVIDAKAESATQTFIEIIDHESGNPVVTVIEFLSPSNKSLGPNRELYLRKQQELCASDTNLVEIDLSRFGTHTLAFPLAHLKPKARTPYMACVRRATRRDKAEVYPMPLWQRLPAIRVPLRPEDADVPLDLQALVEQCYRNGAYDGTIDYAADPDPPLFGGDKDWAAEWLHEKGLRPRKKPARRKDKKAP